MGPFIASSSNTTSFRLKTGQGQGTRAQGHPLLQGPGGAKPWNHWRNITYVTFVSFQELSSITMKNNILWVCFKLCTSTFASDKLCPELSWGRLVSLGKHGLLWLEVAPPLGQAEHPCQGVEKQEGRPLSVLEALLPLEHRQVSGSRGESVFGGEHWGHQQRAPHTRDPAAPPHPSLQVLERKTWSVALWGPLLGNLLARRPSPLQVCSTVHHSWKVQCARMSDLALFVAIPSDVCLLNMGAWSILLYLYWSVPISAGWQRLPAPAV